jgi:hypothetical protein
MGLSLKTIRKKLLFIVFAAAGVPVADGCRADNFAFDRAHAEVIFTYYVGLVAQYGRFTDLSGSFEFRSQGA